CWSVAALTDLKLGPFHLLASEGRVHSDKNHTWHMDMLAKVCREDPELLLAPSYRLVDLTDPASQAEGVGWWTELTRRGGEGVGVGGPPARLPPGGRGGPPPPRREVPGAGVPADHLRPGLHRR